MDACAFDQLKEQLQKHHQEYLIFVKTSVEITCMNTVSALSLSLCLCMYVCICICICIYIYTFTFTYTYIHTYIHTYMKSIHMYVHTEMHVCVFALHPASSAVCVQLCVCVCVFTFCSTNAASHRTFRSLSASSAVDPVKDESRTVHTCLNVLSSGIV